MKKGNRIDVVDEEDVVDKEYVADEEDERSGKDERKKEALEAQMRQWFD